MRRVAAALFLSLAVAVPGNAPAQQPADWRRLASDSDRARLRGWRTSWIEALAAARTGAGRATIAAEPALFDPDHALDGAVPPFGAYRCRRFRLGAVPVAGPWGACRIEEDKGQHRLVVMTGDQRPVGLLLPDTASRMVFLGSLTIGDERRAMPYGRDRQRDVAGLLERIGDRSWRLTIPQPTFGGPLDVIELVPA